MHLGIARSVESASGPVPPPRLVVASDAGLLDLATAAELDLRANGAEPARAAELARLSFPPSLTALLAGGQRALDETRRLVASAPAAAFRPAESMQLMCPVDPPGFRDFMIFDEHVRNTYAPSGKEPPAVLYELPAYYKASTATLIGPDATVPWPSYAASLDYELEFAVVISRAGVDLTPDVALDHVLGVTVLNDFSAREMQFAEMRSRLGPAKGKDFATAVGPWVTTLDEIDIHSLELSAAVNGTEVARGSSAGALWPIEEAIAWASAGEPLRPGDLIGSGTLGGGSGLETDRRLATGDIVEMSITGVGSLRNVVGSRTDAGWQPGRRFADTATRG
jgi:2-keto-4-pentenoate hydratase/2-oxohepta-3-ene-1,7-dioic acid hydratase in catechol pathway